MFYTLVIYPLTQIIEFVYSFCYKIFGNTCTTQAKSTMLTEA